MGEPVRIQLKRVKGWRMPSNTVKVDRSTLWGNRYKIGTHSNTLGRAVETLEECVDLYARVVWNEPHQHRYVREILRGKNLACWCPLDAPCHADVLLKIANAAPGGDR
jgi:hypothetical protein